MPRKEYAASDELNLRVSRKPTRSDREALLAESLERSDSTRGQRAKERADEAMSERVRGFEQDKEIDAIALDLKQQRARLVQQNEPLPLDHRQQQPLKGIEA